MFITSKHREYWNHLIACHPEERDQNGVELNTLRTNLALNPVDRVRQMERYRKALEEIFPNAGRRLEGCIVTNRLKAILEEYISAKQSREIGLMELALWAVDILVPTPYQSGASRIPRSSSDTWQSRNRPMEGK